jgi:hypothetical protein
MNLKSSLVTYETKVDTFPAVLPFYDTQYRVPYVPQMIAAIIGHDLSVNKSSNRKSKIGNLHYRRKTNPKSSVVD